MRGRFSLSGFADHFVAFGAKSKQLGFPPWALDCITTRAAGTSTDGRLWLSLAIASAGYLLKRSDIDATVTGKAEHPAQTKCSAAMAFDF